MAQMTVPYQTNQLPEQNAPLPVIPAADYMGVILSSEIKPTKDESGQYIQLECEVIEDPMYVGHRIIERINFNNPSEKTVQIANGTIRGINEACAIEVLNDTVQWHNIPMIMSVGVEDASGSYAAKNKVTRFMPSGRAVAAAPVQTTPVAPPPSAQPYVAPPLNPAAVAAPLPPAPEVVPAAPAPVVAPAAAPPQVPGVVPPAAVPQAPAPVATAPAPPVATPAVPAAPVAAPAPVAPVAPSAPTAPVAGTTPAF